MDIRMPVLDGLAATRLIKSEFPELAVVILTASEADADLFEAVKSGAQGYLLKSASEEAIVKSIEIVAGGQASMDPRLTQQLLAWVRDERGTAQRERMEDGSSVDFRVLSLVAAGKSNKEIAQELNVTLSVVMGRLRAVYKRLNISRRSEAAKYFVQWEKGLSGHTNLSH